MRCNHAETIKPNNGTIGSSLAWPRIAPSAGTSIAMAALIMTCLGAMYNSLQMTPHRSMPPAAVSRLSY